MDDSFGSNGGIGGEASRKPQWRTPVLSTDNIADSTQHTFRVIAGIDRYEGNAPHYNS